MYNYDQAVARCTQEGMTIATPQQVQVAWNQGMSSCYCGWLADRTIRFPIQYPEAPCGGGTSSGLITCGQDLANVYCYK